MTTYVRPAAVARDNVDMLVGWNISPNTGYTLQATVTASAVVVILSSADGSTLLGSGLALIGTAQPVVITPISGQSINMTDTSLGWHLLLTTDGTEGARTIVLDPMVDLAARTAPIYADGDLELAVATADINAGTHYVRDITVTCPAGLDAEAGDIVSVPVDGEAVTGQVESAIWSGDADGARASVVVRTFAQIRPAAYVAPPAPPAVVDDTAETDAATATSGNVLTNDIGILTVVAVNGLTANVGHVITGSDGGEFVINADGSWAFDPIGDFANLEGSDTATTSVSYHASNGASEASATLTITVSSADAQLWDPSMIPGAVWVDADTVALNGSTVAVVTDKVGGIISATQGIASAQPTLVTDALNGEDVIQFDGGDWLSFGITFGKPANWTIFVVGMFASMSSLTALCGSLDSSGNARKSWGGVVVGRIVNDGKFEYSFGNDSLYSYGKTSIKAINAGDWFLHTQRFASGQSMPNIRVNGTTFVVQRGAGTATTCGGTPYEFAIGRNGAWPTYAAAGSRLKGFVCVPSAISDADAQRLEGYYAHLCGLAGLLPVDHQYKSAPPTI